MTTPTRLRGRHARARDGGVLLALLLTSAVRASAQSSSTLSLDDAIAAARQHAPQVQIAARRAEGARQAAGATTLLTNPSFEARVENWGGGSHDSIDKDVFLVATQPIELAGRATRRRAMAKATAAAADADLARAAYDSVMAVIAGYLDAVRARDEVALLDDQVTRLERAVATMRARVTEGVSTEGDLRRLESEAVRLTIALERRMVDRDEATAALGLMLGRAVDASALVVPALMPPAGSVPGADAVEGHPAVAGARLRAAAADALVMVEASQRLPVLLVSGGYKRTSGVSTGVAALGLTLPVFDRNQAARRRAEGDAAAARLEFEAARAAVGTALSVQRTTAERLARAASNLDATLLEPARIARDAAYAAVLEGAADVVKLVDADRAYADARLDALSLIADAVLAQRRLVLMTGSE